MADTLLCLDIHEDTIAAVVVDRSTKINLVTGCGFADIADQTFAEAIDQVKEQTGFISGASVVTCGAELFSFRNLTLPFKERKKIEQVLPFELDDRLPVDTKSLLADFLVAKEGPQGADIIAALISREYLADTLTILDAQGINPDSIGISGLSTVLTIAENGEAESFVVIDIGTRWATLFVVMERRIALIRSLDIPAIVEGQTGTADLFFLSVKQTLLASRLLNTNTPDYCVYLTGIADRWGDSADLSQCLDGAEIRQFELHMRRSIKFQPEIRDRYRAEVMDRVLAIGLKGGPKSRVFNFRKDEFKKRKSFGEYRNLLVKGAAPLIVVVLAVIGYWVYEYRNLLAQQEQLRSQIVEVFKETVPEAERIVNPIQQLQVINKQIRATYRPGGDNRAGFTIIDLLAELSARIPASYRVKVVRLVADADTVRIKATTGDFNTVDNIQKELGKSIFFSGVTISSANQSSQNDEVNFELKLDLARK